MSVVANVAINVDSRNAVSKLREVQSQSQQTERAIGDLGGAIGKLAAAFSLIQAAKFVFVNAAEIETQTRSLQVLTGSAEKAGQIVKDLQQLGAVTPFTSSELIDSAKRLQAFGIEANKVVETTRRLADVSGATGAELQGLVTAYGQVQAKGRLQGEELLQFQERGVALQQVLREEYGLSGEEFQKALEKGRISAEAVEFAIQKLTDAGGKYANGAIAQSDTLNGRLSTLQDSIQVLAQTIGRTLAPVFQWALTQATAVVSEIQRILDEANNAGGARDREAQFARNADAAVRAMRLNPFTQQGMMADMRQRNIEQQRADYRLRQQQARTPSAPSITTLPPLLGAAAGGGKGRGGKSDAEKAAEKAAREAERLKQQTEQQLQAAKDLQFTQANQLLQLRAKNDFEQIFVEFGIKRSEIERKYNELLQQSKSTEETKLLQQARAAEYKQSSLTLEQRALELTKQATQPLDDILKNLQDQAAYQREYGELIKNGTNPELAKQIIEINRAYEASTAALEPALAAASAAVTKAEAEGAAATEIEKYRKELEQIQKIQGGLKDKRGQAIDVAKDAAPKKPTVLDGIGERIKQLKEDLNPVKLATDSIVNGANAIGSAFGQAFQDVATGAKSTQEALADAFESIGKAFVSMAAEIIAKQMTLIILQTIFNALSGSGGGSSVVQGVDMPVSQMPAGMAFRANGGPVSSNQPYIVGERGPELFVPGVSGSVVSNNDTRAMLNQQTANRQMNAGGSAMQQKPIEVKYESTVINGVEYVTTEQHQRGIALAAERGRALTLQTLQNSVKTRKRVGMA